MDFLNIGSGEFVFLILLAILLVGPKRAVEWVQQFSRFAARIRQEWLAVQRDVLKEVQALSQETASALQPALQEAAQSVQTFQEAQREIASLQKQIVTEGLPLPDVLEPTDDFAG
ncbi:MAG: hypothetical protein H5T61_01970 [Thermoflexales bacterium]|nr:hypothetical protein [Thermoflexales bacterium]